MAPMAAAAPHPVRSVLTAVMLVMKTAFLLTMTTTVALAAAPVASFVVAAPRVRSRNAPCMTLPTIRSTPSALWQQGVTVRDVDAADDEGVTTYQASTTLTEGPGADVGDDNGSRRAFLLLSCTAASLLLLGTPSSATSAEVVEPSGSSTISAGAISTATSSLSSSTSVAESSTASTATTANTTQTIDVKSILDKATKRALSGGRAGASAAVVQVLTLMWLRTAMNYQYRYGGTLTSSLSTLYSEGGIPRFYRGLPFALVQGPLTRFGDTAANVGVLALLDGFDATAGLPLPLRTAAGSVAAGLWRIFLMPVDTSKTVLQVEGSDGLDRLIDRVKERGPGALYQGALASAAATAAGHFPWFATYNFLNEALPTVESREEILLNLVRSAFLGLSASCVSDCCSNSLRVIKTTKQTAGLAKRGGDEVVRSNAVAAAEAKAKVLTGGEPVANTTEVVEVTSGKGGTVGDEAAPTTATVKNRGEGSETNATHSHAATNAAVGEPLGAASETSGEVSYREALAMVLEEDGIRGLFGRGLQTRLLTNAIQGAAFSVLWKYFQTVGTMGGGGGG